MLAIITLACGGDDTPTEYPVIIETCHRTPGREPYNTKYKVYSKKEYVEKMNDIFSQFFETLGACE